MPFDKRHLFVMFTLENVEAVDAVQSDRCNATSARMHEVAAHTFQFVQVFARLTVKAIAPRSHFVFIFDFNVFELFIFVIVVCHNPLLCVFYVLITG